MDLAQEIRKVIKAPEVMEKGLVDEPNAILEAAKNGRFVEYSKLNLLKYKLNPEDTEIYCEGFDDAFTCNNCPIEKLGRGTEVLDCNVDLHKYVNFMKAVVDAAEKDIG